APRFQATDSVSVGPSPSPKLCAAQTLTISARPAIPVDPGTRDPTAMSGMWSPFTSPSALTAYPRWIDGRDPTQSRRTDPSVSDGSGRVREVVGGREAMSRIQQGTRGT